MVELDRASVASAAVLRLVADVRVAAVTVEFIFVLWESLSPLSHLPLLVTHWVGRVPFDRDVSRNEDRYIEGEQGCELAVEFDVC